MPAFVDDADQQEERAGRDAVVQLLHDAAGDAHRIQREHAEHYHRHVADRRVCDQPLPVLLRQRDQRAVNDADDRQQHHHRDEMAGCFRQNRKAEAQESVGAHLQQDGGQNHRAGGRRIGMRVGQPGVEREHRHFDREAEEERQEHPPLQVERHVQAMELGDVERVDAGDAVVVEVERQNAEQHDDAADQRVEEELDRRVEPVGAAPDTDQEIHRHQHHFPEQEEQQEIERHERAKHAGLQHQQEDVVLLDALFDRGPRRQCGDRPHHRGQQDQQDG